MSSTNQHLSPLKDKRIIIGLILIFVSFSIHLFIKNSAINTRSFDMEGLFYSNYIIAVVYFIGFIIMRFADKSPEMKKSSHRYFIISLVLFSISCFTINIPFNVFDRFSSWVNVYLIIIHLALIGVIFIDDLNDRVKPIVFFGLGLGVMLTFYFSAYLLPHIGIAFLGAIFFGLSLHLIAPLIMLITILILSIKRLKKTPEKLAFIIGIFLPLFVLGLYTYQWNKTRKLIHSTQATLITRPDNKLPNWLLLSQEIGDGFFAERILKGDLVYQTDIFSNARFSGSMNSMSEVKEHDPLVTLGSAIMGEINLSRDERIKILESKFDLRHETKRKLWRGNNLSTSSVLTNIQVFPEYRLAYTEKIIRIKNKRKSWQSQEALYTFHLPEGSVATSLSLWIDGKEEKSRLTTKHKADSAYTKIVGVERRDPSVLHWQEGNTITVYVFPCTAQEERQFKIGITSPLRMENDQLILENIYFEGPEISNTLETCVVEFKSEESISPKLPSSFDEILPNKFQFTGNYRPYWEVSCNVPRLSSKLFSFQGNSYHIKKLNKENKPTHFDTIFLDINKSWSSSEFSMVWKTVKDKQVYVFYDQLYLLNEDNKDKYFSLLNKLNFSLFPLNKIKNTTNSLVISKSTPVSPELIDLKESKFIVDLKNYLSAREDKIYLYSLSEEISPYLKTLKEFQVFNYSQGSITKLNELIKNETYPSDIIDDNTVNLSISNTQIIRDSISKTSEAPDHLLRLFAYNKIMQDCGRNYFTDESYIEDELVGIANEAYIVSPISSLIVLETIKDYERFNIDKNKNSLKNASTNSSGSVPEPHEWAMIILLFLTLAFLTYKRRIKTNIS